MHTATDFYQEDLKLFRREATGTFDVRPAPYPDAPSGTVTPVTATVPDYATATNHIDLAVAALSEALPSGQDMRIQAAYLLLRAGVDELGVWLRARGMKV